MSRIEKPLGTIAINSSDFKGLHYQPGKILFSFVNCRFTKLVIENDHEIRFKDISIGFFGCMIHEIEVINIVSKNISIGFYGSVISGRITNENLAAVNFNNCLLPASMFVLDVPRVTIKYTKENFEAGQWNKLFLKFMMTGIDAMDWEAWNYHIERPGHLEISSNFELADESFRPSFFLKYYPAAVHVQTTIMGVSARSLSISGGATGKMSIENARIDSLYIYDFVPQGSVSFYNVGPISRLGKEVRIGIHNSKLDGVEFDNISFDSYPIISFYRSKFSKALFTSCDFPENYITFSRFVPIENVHYPDEKPKNYDKAQYEIFLQLKKALEDGGNFYEAQKLQAISQEALKKIKSIGFWDKVILKINSSSNDHGLSIKRPFFGLLIFSIPIYCLYLLSVDRIFNSNEIDWSLIGYYFAFIDITHRNNFLVEREELTGWSVLLDYLGKLSVGFFIYQFVAAFRKYGKK